MSNWPARVPKRGTNYGNKLFTNYSSITTLAILCLAVDLHVAMVSPWRAPKTLVSINSLADDWMDTKSTLGSYSSLLLI